ncbi:MAG TPA: methanogen output domain 1-containing protein, partial [Methanobacterium sp.]|nr:methanogen output domain 1-containing protein [Methanobacterium sp.]
GWDHDSAISRPLSEVFHITNKERNITADDYVVKILENDALIELPSPMLLVNKKGDEILIEESTAPIKDENGKIIGVALIFRDVTERQKALKEREELLKDKARGELSSFMISALPVFASNIPPQVRTYISQSFADRFEKIIKPQFQEELNNCLKTRDKKNPDDVLSCYLSWISEFMSNLDINTEISSHNGKDYLRFNNCPWTDEDNITPVFCLICRAIVIRSFTWTSLRGHVEQSNCLLEGSDKCSFEFIINIENSWSNELL